VVLTRMSCIARLLFISFIVVLTFSVWLHSLRHFFLAFGGFVWFLILLFNTIFSVKSDYVLKITLGTTTTTTATTTATTTTAHRHHCHFWFIV